MTSILPPAVSPNELLDAFVRVNETRKDLAKRLLEDPELATDITQAAGVKKAPRAPRAPKDPSAPKAPRAPRAPKDPSAPRTKKAPTKPEGTGRAKGAALKKGKEPPTAAEKKKAMKTLGLM